VNEIDDIKRAFEPYYTSTIISEGTDINTLNDLRSAIFAVYQFDDHVLDGFVALIDPFAEEIHEKANSFLDEVANRIIEELPKGSEGDVVQEDKYGEFLSIANMYIKRYPYLAGVLGYSDISHEKLYLLLKYLLKKLPRDPKKPLIEILKYIDMDSVRVVRKLQSSVTLSPEGGDVRQEEIIPGAPLAEIEDVLSQIIQDVNKRWGVDFGPEQQQTLSTMSEELASNEDLQNVVSNNVKQNAEIHFGGIFENKVDDQFDRDRKLWEQLTNNKELRTYVQKSMFKFIFEKVLALRE
jgi:type I restriction enzyme R subunit